MSLEIFIEPNIETLAMPEILKVGMMVGEQQGFQEKYIYDTKKYLDIRCQILYLMSYFKISQYVENLAGVYTSRIMFQLKLKFASYTTNIAVYREYMRLV